MRIHLRLLSASLWLAATLPASAAPNYALLFDGVDDYVETGVAVIPTNGDFTVSCWVYAVGSTNPANMEVISQGSPGNAFYLGAANGRIRVGDGWSDTGWVFPTDNWHQFAVVKTDTDTRLYLDGQLLASRGEPIPNPAAQSGLRLGRQYANNGEFFRGRLADVRIWKRSLTQEEIRATWDQAAEWNDPGLVAGWRFDEMAGNICTPVAVQTEMRPMKKLVDHRGLKTSIANVGIPAFVGRLIDGTDWRLLPDAPARLHAWTASYHRPATSYSLMLNGWDNWVDTGVAAIPASGDFTVECWANCSQLPNDGGRGEILSQGSAGNAFYLGVGDGKLRLGDGWDATDLTFPMGGWHHFAVVKTSSETRFYLDGTNVLNRGWAIPNPSGETKLRLGRQYGSYGENWPGLIDEVRVWSRALSTEEIRAGMYYAPDAGSPELEAYWPLNVSNADASGHGHPLNLDGWPSSGWTAGMGGELPGMGWQPVGVGWQGGSLLIHECHQPYSDPVAYGATAVAGGYNRSLALTTDGKVVFWGIQTPAWLCAPPDLDNVVAISASELNWLALRADGKVVSWGVTASQNNVPWNLSNVVAIATSKGHCLALTSNGTLVVWGVQDSIAQRTTSLGKLYVPAEATNIVAIGGKWYHWIAARADGRVFAWGFDGQGQCDVPASATNVVAVEGGEGHSLALRRDGTVVAWGNNCHGECNVPATATNGVAISTYGHHNLLLRADGTVVGWGNNGYGQCNMPDWATNVVGIAAGLTFTVLLRADGSFSALGDTYAGRVSVPYAGFAHEPIFTDQSVDGDTPGIYKLTYCITNHLGRIPLRTRTVIVRDTTVPEIALHGTNMVYLITGSNWSDPGATASDACAGDLTSRVVVGGNLDLNTPGAYAFRYTATDPSGNSAFTNRTVHVGTEPEIAELAGAYASSETTFGTCSAELRVTVNPRGLPTTVIFEYGLPGGDTSTLSVDLAGVFAATNITVTAGWLAPGTEYRWRVIATNLAGAATSPDQVLDIPPVPSLSGISGRCVTNDPTYGTIVAQLRATANGNSQPTTVLFQYGRNTNYSGATQFDLPAASGNTNLLCNLPGLVPNYQYHWRVVASNAFGVVASPDYVLVARIINAGGVIGGGATSPMGDFDGNGTVDRSEVDSVFYSYLSAGATLTLTNLAGLGQSQVSVTVPELPGAILSVLVSTNLSSWENLGPALPRYEFTDTNAPAGPQRYYRIRWP